MSKDYRNLYEYCEEEKGKEYYDMNDDEQNQVVEEYQYETGYDEEYGYDNEYWSEMQLNYTIIWLSSIYLSSKDIFR